MSYQVIARKYRPAKFADITAQEHITRTIQNSLRMERVGHGYIFSGLRGVGKTTAARVFAKALNCQRMIEDADWLRDVTEPCGECESCRDFDAGTSMNIAEFDAASNNSVDDIRTLRDNVRYGPQKGRYRVYIIDEVHMLSIAAFNAFLKTLEEPPPHAIFIFATTELHKIPATIASRCQRFNFKRIPLDAIQTQLQGICEAEGIKVDADALQLVSRKAQGSMRDAQSILDQVIAFSSESGEGISYQGVRELLNYIDDEQLFAVTDAITGHDAPGMIEVAQFVISNGYDEQDFLEKLIEHLRNFLMVINLRSTRLVERPEGVKERYQKESVNFTPAALMRMTAFLLDTQKELKFQFEYQFRFELALLRLLELDRPSSELQPAPVESGDSKKKAPEQPAPALSRETRRRKPEKPALKPVVECSPASAPLPEQVAPVTPSVPLQSAAAAEPGSGNLDLGSWQKKFTGYVANPVAGAALKPEDASPANTPDNRHTADLDALRVEWVGFIEHINRTGNTVLGTHLLSCELLSCTPQGVVAIACCRKFSCEELIADASLLKKELTAFYNRPLSPRIRYDADRDACTREKSVFTLFQELSAANPVVQFLVTEFGSELIY
ncbi:DNA polymerase III subunit gamma/tau [Chlorobium phaeovibrioides]|uniref:DNA polymerase III subunit gamma/tau n=1 Tax=Chlorobium phaeovibrioides TaxID=1094 RepID=UPI001F006989|nr:DNA polymerase III subunit gamma/tau [Chlorobium phaeovibrioides]